jgi:hypothetical protein
MKTIEVSTNNFWLRLWMWLTMEKEDLPITTCDFKRDLMLFGFLNILFFPVIFIIRGVVAVIRYYNERNAEDTVSLGKAGPYMGALIQLVSYLIGIAINASSSIWANLLIGTISMIIGTALVLLFVFIGVRVANYFEEHPKHIPTPKPVTFAKEMYNSAKDKYCARITYISGK